MTKFEEIFKRGKPLDENVHCGVEFNPSYLEWQKLHEEVKAYFKKTKNRVPIVDFKIRVDDTLN